MEESLAVSPRCKINHFSVITGSLALFESDCRVESDPNVVSLTQSWTDLIANMLLIVCKCSIQIVWWEIKNVLIMLGDCLKCATIGHKTKNATLFFTFYLMMYEWWGTWVQISTWQPSIANLFEYKDVHDAIYLPLGLFSVSLKSYRQSTHRFCTISVQNYHLMCFRNM